MESHDTERGEQIELTSSNPRIGDGRQQQYRLPLGVELTGYRLFTTSVIIGLGIPKAVYSSRGQSLISNTLDWVAGMICALILFWLGVIEGKCPESSPRFFSG